MNQKIWILIFSLLTFGCEWQKPKTSQATTTTSTTKKAEVKNLIFLIGDGMGLQQISFARAYAKFAPGSKLKDRELNIEKFAKMGSVGLTLVEPEGALVVDSAASATQYATGYSALSEVIGLDENGDPVETILEKAHKKGLATGLVSDTRITHATPASFGAHVAHRSMENKIAEHLIGSGADVLFSGGLRHFLPQGVNNKESAEAKKYSEILDGKVRLASKRSDDIDLVENAKKAGFEFVHDKQSMNNSTGSRLLGLFTTSGMPNGIKHRLTKDKADRTIPSLKEMTIKALEVLSKDPDGFFLMIEGGQIDWMGHQNDAGGVLQEMLKFDETIGYVMEWVKNRTDTLVVLTADHETGSMGFSYSAFNLPIGEKVSGKGFIERLYKPNFNFGRYKSLDSFNQQSKGLGDLVKDYGKRKTKSPESFQATVKKFTSIEITLKEAASFFEMEDNQYYVEGHTYLGVKRVPKMGPKTAFYGIVNNNYATKLGAILGKYQSVTWGAGTHTSTPVGLFALGPKEWTEKYDGMIHSTEVGKINMQALGLSTDRNILDVK